MKRRQDLEELSSFKNSVQKYKDIDKKERLSCFWVWTLGFVFIFFIFCFVDIKLLVYPGFLWLVGMIFILDSYKTRKYDTFWVGELKISRKRVSAAPRKGQASGVKKTYLIYEQNGFEENMFHTSKTLYDFFESGKEYYVVCCGEVIIDVFL